MTAATERRRVTRDLVVVRSCPTHVTLEESSRTTNGERSGAPGATLCRASYRTDPTGDDNPIMVVRFSMFDTPYEISSSTEGKFVERIAPGAFSKTIMERASQIKVMFNHGVDGPTKDMILGKTIALEERGDGTYAEVELFDTSYNKDLLPGLRAGVYGSSFMFHVVDDKWDDHPTRSASNPKGLPERTVNAVRLLEFGPVTWPANPATSAGLRSHTDELVDRLRSANPDRYNELNQQYARFREVYNLAETRDTPADGNDVIESAPRQLRIEPERLIQMKRRAAEILRNAPVTSHASETREEETNSAATRRARMQLAGVNVEREDYDD